MNKIRPLIAASLLLAAGAFAQMPPEGHRPPPDIAKQLNLDPTRAAQVDAIMKATRAKAEALHAQMKALHDSTRAQLATVLTPDEMKKLPGPMGELRPISIGKRLGLDEARSQQVEAIMKSTREQAQTIHTAMKAATTDAAREEQRQKMKALHDSTKAQLATVLTPEEMKKLHDGMMRPPRGPWGGGHDRPDAPPA
ncbi:MAG TPA: hypothetical protein VF928_10485 [Usitatibacteraceae bacterium]